MDPDDRTQKPDRGLAVPVREAAANVIRGQLDALYSSNGQPAPQETPPPTKADPKVSHEQPSEKHSATARQVDHPKTKDSRQSTATLPPQWQHYHNSWQEYYQEYYNRYYTDHVQRVLQDQHTSAAAPDPNTVSGLQQQITERVRTSATKARKSRHFIPISAAILVMLIFAFLQYNSILIGTVMAYVSPGAINPQDVLVDTSTDIKVSSDPRLIIPKINVDVPVVYNVAPTYDAEMAAMQQGVAHFAIPGADSVPGQIGNTVFSGHSSNDLFEAGDYKFIFSQLDKLQTGDTINVNYQGARYTYAVTGSKVVKPSDVQALIYPVSKPILTLITCTPLGTSTNRLLVTAEQLSPDPSKAAAASADSTNAGGGSSIPGNSPTMLEKMFGSKG